MGHILGLKFKEYGQIYYFDSGAFVVSEGDHVIVKTDLGLGLGRVVLIREELPGEVETDEVKSIYRLATDEDLVRLDENAAMAKEAFVFCRKCIHEHELDMKLVDVEVYFDRSKIVFFFTAPNRIDFRELVKDLVKNYRTRIELRQIGVRHETQMVGAVGNCGQVCCCRRFLRKFAPVTIRMAKEQNLFLNPTKISGICGRLLCCLNYEQKNYESFRKNCPKIGKRYDTSRGQVKVIRANMFRESLSLFTIDGEELEVSIDEWREMNPDRVDPAQLQQQQQAAQERKKAKPQDKQGSRKKGRPAKIDAQNQEKAQAEGAQAEKGAPPEQKAGEQDTGTGPTTYDLAHALAGDADDVRDTATDQDQAEDNSNRPRPKRQSRSRRSRRKPRGEKGKQAKPQDRNQDTSGKAKESDKDGSKGSQPQKQQASGESSGGQGKPKRKRRRKPRKRPNKPKGQGGESQS